MTEDEYQKALQAGQLYRDNDGQTKIRLWQLGQKVPVPDKPEDAVLERIPNPDATTVYVVRLTCPEFTSLCPVTKQPDFAHIVIDYIPQNYLVESKSFKLYMQSYRNHPTFHEACTMEIAKRMCVCLCPHWLRIGGYWYPRGGIPIDIFYQTAEPPSNAWILPQDVSSYRGRG